MTALLDLWHQAVGALPFEWAGFGFMRLALLALLLAAPAYAALGTVVVNQRLAFFSDAIGHSALAGLGIGFAAGLADPSWAMLATAVAAAIAVTLLERATGAARDTVIGVLLATAVALGIVLLSRAGAVQDYGRYLVGDLLSLRPGDVGPLALAALLSLGVLGWHHNQLVLLQADASLARSRGIAVDRVRLVFTATLAVLVTLNVRWVGLLVVNALLLLPAAAARNLARGAPAYVGLSIAFALLSGLLGLVSSFYWETATGATIVLWAAAIFVITAAAARWRTRGEAR